MNEFELDIVDISDDILDRIASRKAESFDVEDTYDTREDYFFKTLSDLDITERED